MAHTPLTGWVEFRKFDWTPATCIATFHSERSCHKIRSSTLAGPQLIGQAWRIRGLDVCECVPDRGQYPEHWKPQGRTFREW